LEFSARNQQVFFGLPSTDGPKFQLDPTSIVRAVERKITVECKNHSKFLLRRRTSRRMRAICRTIRFENKLLNSGSSIRRIDAISKPGSALPQSWGVSVKWTMDIVTCCGRTRHFPNMAPLATHQSELDFLQTQLSALASEGDRLTSSFTFRQEATTKLPGTSATVFLCRLSVFFSVQPTSSSHLTSIAGLCHCLPYHDRSSASLAIRSAASASRTSVGTSFAALDRTDSTVSS
jgi:hypothetical protein